MAMETAMVAILDHHNPHTTGGGFSAFFDPEEEEQLLLEALDAELAQELQFQEALRASLMTVRSSDSETETVDQTQTAPSSPAAEIQISPDPVPEVKWEAGESSLSFCEICKERKQDHQVVRNVYEDGCVCFDCINVNAGGGKPVNDEKKGKTTKKLLLVKKWVGPNPKSKDDRSGGCYEKNGKTKKLPLVKKWVDRSGGASSNRSPPPPPPPPRVDSEVDEKLRMAKEEIRLLREKIQLQHRESMEAMDFQEQFFKDQIKSILEGRASDDGNGKEETSADCSSGSSSVLEPEPEWISAQ